LFPLQEIPKIDISNKAVISFMRIDLG